MPLISFLLPTRGRPDLADAFLRSLHDTAEHPHQIEVVLGVDDDDPPSQTIAHEALAIRRVILPAGQTMGALNRACFEASTGRFVMLINDDVIVRTPGWDTAVYRTFARFDDDVALVHVNDLLFRRRLCTFPILSRKTCLEIGVCPPCYRRYRIDDHICDTYALLAYLGHERRVYLQDVVFEHKHYTTAAANAGPSFQSADGKVYVLQPEVFAEDSRDYAASLADRKQAACQLARTIEAAAVESRQAFYAGLLSEVCDPFGARPEYGEPTAAPTAADLSVEIARLRGRRGRLVTAARAQAISAWRRYQKLPLPLRRVLDPAANAIKWLARPLVRPPEPIEIANPR